MIEKPIFIMGRSHKSDLPIPHDLISREHLKVTLEGEQVFLEDLGSSNGSWLNGNKLNPKKLYSYADETRILLGNSNGPSMSIKCIFRPEEIQKKIQAQEEITLVKKNQLIEVTKVNHKDNIVALRTEALSHQSVREFKMPKVANGHYESSDVSITRSKPLERTQNVLRLKDSPVKTGIEPDLLLQMKNLLDLEAQKAERESQREADEIRNAARKNAEQMILEAKEEVLEIRLKMEEEFSARELKANAEIEQLRISNAKKMNLLLSDAQKESQELVQTASNEASSIRLAAKNFSEETVSKAREKSAKLQKETDYITQLKLEECKKREEENEKNVERLSQVYEELKEKIDGLKQLERDAQSNYDSLTKSILKEEERIAIERESLEKLKDELSITKKECDQQLANLKYEERTVKAQLETGLLEQKLQVTQILAEAKLAQIQRDSLGPEISSLKQEKDQILRLIKEVEGEHQQKIQKQMELGKQVEIAQAELNTAKEQQREVLAEIEKQKNIIQASHDKLAKKENEVALKMKNAEDFSQETAQRIERELQVFDAQKLEMEAKLQKEAHNLRDVQLEEMRQLQNQKIDLVHELEKAQMESHYALEQMKKKNQEDTLAIQRAIKEETQKLKIEANNQINQLKNKFDNVAAQLHRDHLDAKKFLSHEIMRLETSKKTMEQELKILEANRQEKMGGAEQEIKRLLEEAKKKSALILSKSEEEAHEQKTSLAQYKETEIESIKEMKEKALKEIYGKKAERARAVTINIDALILTELQKFRNKKMNDQFIENCSKEINAVVFDTLMDRIGADKNKLDVALKVDAKTKKEEKIFRERVYWVIFIFTIALFFIMIPRILKS